MSTAEAEDARDAVAAQPWVADEDHVVVLDSGGTLTPIDLSPADRRVDPRGTVDVIDWGAIDRFGIASRVTRKGDDDA